jgi:hypothetical protein
MSFLTMLFLLVAAHALCDFPLQGDATAVNKNRHANTPLQKHVPWYYWLGSHALVHGGAVALITGNPVLGLLEVAAHFTIDYIKCEGKISIHVDQLLHLVCKVLWIIILIAF